MDSYKSDKRNRNLNVVVRNHAIKHVTYRLVHITKGGVEFCERDQ